MAIALMSAKDLRKTVMQQGLASYFTHSMLQDLFTNKLTPFQCQQIAQICFSLTKMMIFESQWIRLVNEVARRNLEHSQDDPCFAGGLAQLMGDPPINTLQSQAQLHSLVLQQGKELVFQMMQHVPNLGAPRQSWSTVLEKPSEPYITLTDHLREATEKQTDNVAARETAFAIGKRWVIMYFVKPSNGVSNDQGKSLPL